MQYWIVAEMIFEQQQLAIGLLAEDVIADGTGHDQNALRAKRLVRLPVCREAKQLIAGRLHAKSSKDIRVDSKLAEEKLVQGVRSRLEDGVALVAEGRI